MIEKLFYGCSVSGHGAAVGIRYSFSVRGVSRILQQGVELVSGITFQPAELRKMPGTYRQRDL